MKKNTERNSVERKVVSGMRLSEEEKISLERASEQWHMSQSAFMRYAIFSTIERVNGHDGGAL